MSSAKSYYRLAKPGIVYGNSFHMAAAMLFAWAFSEFRPVAMVGGLIGTALVIASACVVNCITDKDADAKMERTKKRPIPSGEISVRNAAIYAAILGIVGSSFILFLANWIALVCVLGCFLTYTIVYAYAKRKTWLGAAVGTIPGAFPVLAGYATVDPTLPAIAWLLTAMVLVWQLPHFYALSLFRRDDYAKSGMPIISVVKSRAVVVKHITANVLLYVAVTIFTAFAMPKSYVSGALLVIGAFAWAAFIAIAPGRGTDAWARKVFGYSLYLTILFFIAAVIAVAISLVYNVQ